MKHVGDVLEISTRHEIIELYAILELSLGKNIDYEAIRKRFWRNYSKYIRQRLL